MIKSLLGGRCARGQTESCEQRHKGREDQGTLEKLQIICSGQRAGGVLGGLRSGVRGLSHVTKGQGIWSSSHG